jgi:hypothetical protein
MALSTALFTQNADMKWLKWSVAMWYIVRPFIDGILSRR